MRTSGRVLLIAVAWAGGVALLLSAAPPAVIAATLSDPAAVVRVHGPEPLAIAAAAAACWCALGWLALALAVTAAATLPGRQRQVAGRIAARTVPPALRQLLTLGLGVAVATGTAGPALAAPSHAAAAVSAAAATATPDLDWPVKGAATVTRPSTTRAGVVVHTGDSLWSIARDHLAAGATNAEIAAAWPRWYAANRAVIGAAPDLLVPGQRLVPPTDISGGSS